MNVRDLILFFCLGFSGSVLALDHIETKDGGTLTGVIKEITNDAIIFSTDSAGDITVNRDKVRGVSSEHSLAVRLNSGTVLIGPVEHQQEGSLEISSTDARLTTQFSNISESWKPDQQDPEIVRIEEEHNKTLRKWSYEAGADITGRKGNSDEFGVAINLAAKLVGKDDSLLFYGSLNQAEQQGIENTDEIIVGTEYTAYTNEPWGWYVRAELERDDFEGIDLRALLGSGLNYRVFNTPDHTLELRSGLGYRHESFTDGTTEQSPTLDFGLAHNWLFADWGRIKNNLTFAPAITDFGDYLITHDSSLEIPLGLSDYWQLRLGLRHDYKSIPAQGREGLDTSYYSRLQLAW
jgi:putative salt-induced outer membrane protein YdiY